ncbi:MAG: glutathione peroxidase [Mycoplasma sp.]
MNIYDFKILNNKGVEIDFNTYKGKVLLIVNTATRCGFTKQYAELQSLYEELKNSNFEILDFPCNQFLMQAPGTDQEIENFCSINYHTTFERFKKIDVNGKNQHAIYEFLKSNDHENKSKRIKWNFTKFLIDKNGDIVKRFDPAITPFEMKEIIISYINK